MQEKLLPSASQRVSSLRVLAEVNLLKLIGPCHTVSSFLNISSVVMTKWDEVSYSPTYAE